MGVKLKNIKTTNYTVNFPLGNGTVRPYNWTGVHGNRYCELEVDDEVFEYIRYNTNTLQLGYLVLAEDETNEEIKQEVADVTEDIEFLSVEEIKKILTLKPLMFKKKITSDTPKAILLEIVRVANDIKLDSDSIKTYLAGLLGHSETREVLFPINEA